MSNELYLKKEIEQQDAKDQEQDNILDNRTIKWKIHALDADLTADQNDIPSLRFNNLEPGKTYRVGIYMKAVNGGTTANITAFSDSLGTILRNQNKVDANGNEDRSITYTSTIFVAADPILKFSYVEFDPGALVEGGDGGTYQETYAILEELPYHEETDQWD